jgi:hypothetical protein
MSFDDNGQLKMRHHDTQHNGIQRNDTQHKGLIHDVQHNDTQHHHAECRIFYAESMLSVVAPYTHITIINDASRAMLQIVVSP